MVYNETNAHKLLAKFLHQKPKDYDYNTFAHEWFNITIDWFHKNNITSLTKDKVHIDTVYNLATKKPFDLYTLEGVSLVCLDDNVKFFPFALLWFVDEFANSPIKAVKKTVLLKKLKLKKDVKKYEYCNNPLVVLFHELGHWIVYDYYCKKFEKYKDDKDMLARKVNNNIWKMFGTNKIIYDTSIENSAEWFVMYSLNPTFTKRQNPKVYTFFSETIGIKPFINISIKKINEL